MTSTKNNVDFGIDSRYRSKKEKDSESNQLMKTRLARQQNLSKEQINNARLMQLKLRMEDYLKNPVYDDKNYFTQFLKQYVDSLYSKRSNFAHDINITPNLLSKILNNYREPNQEFFYRLMIHSEKVFQHIGEFQKKLWIQVYYQEKICDTMFDQNNWRPKIEKQIKLSELTIK